MEFDISKTMKAAALLVLALRLSTGAGSEIPELSTDAAFVVQLHASRGALAGTQLPEGARSQLMATATGRQFECFLPPLEAGGALESEGSDATQSGDADEGAAFLGFSRAAARQIRPACVQFVDVHGGWVYEVCPGVLVRKVSLKARGDQDGSTVAAATASGDGAALSHQVVELGPFQRDGRGQTLDFQDFVGTDSQERVRSYQNPLYTQHFGPDEAGRSLQVQFMCNAAERDDTVTGVQWAPGDAEDRAAAGFLVTSRVFCDPKYSDADGNDLFTVRSLLQPLAESNTCVKRNEGWWTYEFCFGKGIRQYHRDSDGRITAEFSLGAFDAERNADLEKTGSALVSEHIDATHDVARPAYLELYAHGTYCKEFDNHAPREARVYYYCSQGGTSHHILTVKEMQTCSYTLKVSSPVLCDHPHFINDDYHGSDAPQIVHCVPVEEEGTNSEALADVDVQID